MPGDPANSNRRDLFKEIFISSDEPRLRAGWRLAAQTALMLVIGACMGVPLMLYFIFRGIDSFDINNIGAEFLILNGAYEFAAFTASIYLARRFLDKRSFASLGLALNAKALMDIAAGITITFLMMSLIYSVEYALGWIKFEGFAWQAEPTSDIIKGVLAFVVIFIMTAWNEELLARGYHLQTIASGSNTAWGVVLSSVIFGILHLANPNATWVATIGIFAAGLFFAYGYTRTMRLWLPMGLHFGWNFFEGVVFGFPVSGLDVYRLTRHQVTGPAAWSGGPFGPEAGLIMVPALAIGFVLVHLYTKFRQTL